MNIHLVSTRSRKASPPAPLHNATLGAARRVPVDCASPVEFLVRLRDLRLRTRRNWNRN